MSAQILNDDSFSADAVRAVTGGQASAETEGMTYGGVAVRSLFFLILTVASASAGWSAAADRRPSSGMWFFLGYILLIAISVAAASNPRLAAVAGVFYALLMGFWMGSISRLYETYYDGIVGQAIAASVATFLAVLILYSVRAIRVTGRFVRVVVTAMVGLMFLYLFGWVMSLFGVDLLFWAQPNGLGIAISVGICILAAMNLAIDLAFIERGVGGGAPAVMEWYAAYGLLTTLVWLYLELLRLLALLRSAQ
jgi:uncharacterized YccA/Bax inhibitor family protein